MFDRLLYWSRMFQNPAVKDRFVFQEPLTCCIALPEADMAAINAHIFRIIAPSIPDKTAGIDPGTARGQSKVVELLNATKIGRAHV